MLIDNIALETIVDRFKRNGKRVVFIAEPYRTVGKHIMDGRFQRFFFLDVLIINRQPRETQERPVVYG